MPNKTYIIAEAGVNHNGNLDLAKEMIVAAKEMNADAVKFQLFHADKLVTKKGTQAEYQKKNNPKASQYEMLKALELTQNDFITLKSYAEAINIDFMVTPFDLESVQFINQTLKLPIIKIGSGDITHGPLLLACAKTHKKIILSTGMSTLAEVEQALKVLAFGFTHPNNFPTKVNLDAIINEETQKILSEQVILLHCTSEYPAPYKEINLLAMDTLREAFKIPVGFSDHSVGIEMPLAAVARGAQVIEKHFTLDKRLEGPDHAASLDVIEFTQMIKSIRHIEAALGHGRKCLTESESKNKPIVRRSLVAKGTITKGSLLSQDNIDIKRPAGGLSPMAFWQLLGRVASRDYADDEVLAE